MIPGQAGVILLLVAVALASGGSHAAATETPASEVTDSAGANDGECSMHDDVADEIDAVTRQLIDDQIRRAGQFEIGPRKRFKQCEVTVTDLLITGAKSMLIDVRKPREFKLRRIPGSVNLPGKQVINQRQWQSRPIVLIGKGHSYQRLDQLCLDMKDAGFKQVSVLRGGLRSWQAQGQALTGSEPYGRGLAAMSPQEFFTERSYAHWLLLMSEQVAGLEAGAHIVKVQPGDENAAPTLERKYHQHSQQIDSSPLILVVANDPGEQQQLQAVASGVSPMTFYLDGGSEAYHAHLTQQRIVWSQKPGLRRGTKCGR